MNKLIRPVLIAITFVLLGVVGYLAWLRVNQEPKKPVEVVVPSHPDPKTDPITFDGRMVQDSYPPSISLEVLAGLEDQRLGKLEESSVIRLCEEWLSAEGFEFSPQIRVPSSGYKDMIERRKEYRDRIAVVQLEYDRVTDDPENIREKAREYLNALVTTEAGLPGSLASADLEKLHNELKTLGTTDPCLLAGPPKIMIADVTMMHMRECVSGMKSKGYSPQVIIPVAVDAVRAAGVRGYPGSEVFASQLGELFCDYLASLPEEKDKQWHHWNHAFHWLERLPVPPKLIVYEALLRDDRLDKSLMHFVAGVVRKDLAWHYRTGKTADQVTDEQWSLFGESARIASLHLRTAWRMNPELPFAPSELISLAMAGEDEWTPRQWFELSVNATFDYKPAYTAYLTSVLPKWGGSAEEVISFARECMQTRAFGSLVPEYVFGILDEYNREKIGTWDDPAVQDVMRKCADEFLAWLDQPESHRIDKLALAQTRSWLTAYLIRHQDYGRAGQILRALDCPDDFQILHFFHPNPELALSRCRALSIGEVEALSALDSRIQSAYTQPWSKEELDEVTQTLQTAIAHAPDGSLYLDLLETTVRSSTQFAEDPSVATPLNSPKAIHAWQFVNGYALIQPDGSFRLHSPTASEQIHFAYTYQLPRPVVFTATIEPPAVPENPKAMSANYPPSMVVINQPYTFPPSPSRNARDQQHLFVCPAPRKRMKIQFHVTDSTATLTVDGIVVASEPISNIVDPANRDYRGTVWFTANSGTVFYDISIQRPRKD